jgi:hypothetical protein
MQDGRELVSAVREAAAIHKASWEALVPDSFTINLVFEADEEAAYAAMATAKARLRDHICTVYGLSIRELASLALP